MAEIIDSFIVPHRTELLEETGFLTRPWEWFFRRVWERLIALGIEQSFAIENGASTSDIVGMKLNYRGVSHAIIEFLVQRVTTGAGAVELIEHGTLIAVYRPTSNDWALLIGSPTELPSDAGMTFSITSAGQVRYAASNETGTHSISKIYWRTRTLGGKNALYSAMGAR